MNAGTEWFVDAEGCLPERLRDLRLVREFCNTIITELKLMVVGEPQWHQFPYPGGVTGLYLLSESHLACHTYPEDGVITFNLYCCRPRPRWPWQDRLAETLGAEEVRVRFAHRGESPGQEGFGGSHNQSVADQAMTRQWPDLTARGGER
jgi:S-adenosylmethionine decarboxylase